ncbi:MAG: hypothetical protein LUF27_13160 [Lachnospiraceae bacterium]|nr:hypothetical protein [Lachnospiraceae bacterium]
MDRVKKRNARKKTKRNVLILTAAELLLVLVVAAGVCYAVYGQQASVKKYDTSGCAYDEETVVVTLDAVTQEPDSIQIWGWAISTEKDTEYFDSWVLLRAEESGEYFRIPTAVQTRTDVTEVLGNGEFNYDNSGFYAQVETKRLGQGSYEVCLAYNVHSDHVIQGTGVTVVID